AQIDVDVELDVLAAAVACRRSEALLRLLHVALERALLYGAARALPVGRVGAQLLRDDREAVPERGVPDLLAPEHLHAPLDVLARDGRLELLEPEEVLIVELAEAVEARLQLTDQYFDLLLVHGARLTR